MTACPPPDSTAGEHRLHGRTRELEALDRILTPEGSDVWLVTGVPGIGKSALLRAWCARTHATPVVLLDGRAVEPTPDAFLAALTSLGFPIEGDTPAVLCVDHYEHLMLLDPWLRTWSEGLARRPVRLVLASREALPMGWIASSLRTRVLHLDVLDPVSARARLREAGIGEDRAQALLALTRGHPLALELAAALDPGRGTAAPNEASTEEVVQELTHYFLDQIEDPRLREILEAMSVVRRVTRPMLAAMIDDDLSSEQFSALSRVPLVESRSDGLRLHPTVHETVARWLRSADPARFTRYRRHAWHVLEETGQSVGAGDLWRLTADVIYLIDDPVIREAFFPSGGPRLSVDPAREEDRAGLADLIRAEAGPEDTEALLGWLADGLEAFHAVRDADGELVGGYVLMDPATVTSSALAADPVATAWVADLPASLRSGHRRVLFLRRWLGRGCADAPSAIQGACWLDVKRAYLEGRPLLRRVYLAVGDLAPYAPAATKLGFVPLTELGVDQPQSAMLDFGAGSVDAWLGRLVRDQLGLRAPTELDVDRRAFVVRGVPVSLTPRELAVVQLLLRTPGETVSRKTLMDEAWEGGCAVGSNVVEVLVRGLRKKLGQDATLLETVRGVGYRWRG